MPGWKLKREEIEDQINSDVDELVNLMARTPEKVTGRNAFRLGMRIKANRDFLEGIENDCRI